MGMCPGGSPQAWRSLQAPGGREESRGPWEPEAASLPALTSAPYLLVWGICVARVRWRGYRACPPLDQGALSCLH